MQRESIWKLAMPEQSSEVTPATPVMRIHAICREADGTKHRHTLVLLSDGSISAEEHDRSDWGTTLRVMEALGGVPDPSVCATLRRGHKARLDSQPAEDFREVTFTVVGEWTEASWTKAMNMLGGVDYSFFARAQANGGQHAAPVNPESVLRYMQAVCAFVDDDIQRLSQCGVDTQDNVGAGMVVPLIEEGVPLEVLQDWLIPGLPWSVLVELCIAHEGYPKLELECPLSLQQVRRLAPLYSSSSRNLIQDGYFPFARAAVGRNARSLADAMRSLQAIDPQYSADRLIDILGAYPHALYGSWSSLDRVSALRNAIAEVYPELFHDERLHLIYVDSAFDALSTAICAAVGREVPSLAIAEVLFVLPPSALRPRTEDAAFMSALALSVIEHLRESFDILGWERDWWRVTPSRG